MIDVLVKDNFYIYHLTRLEIAFKWSEYSKEGKLAYLPEGILFENPKVIKMAKKFMNEIWIKENIKSEVKYLKIIDNFIRIELFNIKEITQEKVHEIIDNRKPLGLFYSYDNTVNKYIGVDNLNGDCWVEEFNSLNDCLDWLIK